MSTISSRTPEGEPVRCPICGHALAAIPSKPLLDTTCPSCGCLLIVDRKTEWANIIAVAPKDTQFNAGDRPAGLGESGSTPAGNALENVAPEDLLPGMRVRIPRGTFEGFVAAVESVDLSAKKATLKITVFGRDTMVVLSFADLVIER